MERIYMERKMFSSLKVGELIQALKNFDENSSVMLGCETVGTNDDTLYVDIDYIELEDNGHSVFICGR